MTNLVEPGRLTRASMLDAAAQLKSLSERPQDGAWLGAARAAVRAAVLAVEEELGEIAASDGLTGRVIGDEPRLLPTLERIEAKLASMLVTLWEARAGVPGGASPADLAPIAKNLQELAGDAFSLIHELYDRTTGLD